MPRRPASRKRKSPPAATSKAKARKVKSRGASARHRKRDAEDIGESSEDEDEDEDDSSSDEGSQESTDESSDSSSDEESSEGSEEEDDEQVASQQLPVNEAVSHLPLRLSQGLPAGCPRGLFKPRATKLNVPTQQQVDSLRVLSNAQCEQTVRRLVRLVVFAASQQGVVKFTSMEKCLPSGVKPRHVWPLLRLVNDRLRALFGLELRKKMPNIQTFAAQAKAAARNARAGKQKSKKKKKKSGSSSSSSSSSSSKKKQASSSSTQPRQFIVVNVTAPAPRIANWNGDSGESTGGFPQLDTDQVQQAMRCDTHYAELAKGPTGIQKSMRGLAMAIASLILASDKVDERGNKYVNSKMMRNHLQTLFKGSIDSGSGSHFGGIPAVKLVKMLTAQHYLATSEDPEEERDADGRILQAYWVGQRLEEEVGPHALLHFATALCKRDLGANEWKHFAKSK